MKLLNLSLAILGILTSVATASDKPVNVLLILADDIGFECFSSYGSKEYSTPRLDALAAAGIRFENCHSTPVCTPSRVNLLSGKSNVFNYEDFGIYPAGEPTFAHQFRQSGYATAVAGKWQLLTAEGGTHPNEAGFDTYCLWNTPSTTRERYWNPSLEKGGALMDLPDDSYGPDVCTDFLAEFITSCAETDTPFLAYYPMILVHDPFLPTPNSKDRGETSDKKNFIDMVNYMDVLVGRLVDTLEAQGVRDNTLIIFTADNGTNKNLVSEFNGQRISGGKGFTRDHGTHVPLIANWPGRIPAKQVNRDLIAFSDFLPTMVEAAGLPPKESTDADGVSFWPQCLSEPGNPREWIYGYYFPHPYAKKFNDSNNHPEVRYARDRRYKLYDNGDLYDTQMDVMETAVIDLELAAPTVKQAHRNLQAAINAYPDQGLQIDHSKVRGVYPPK